MGRGRDALSDVQAALSKCFKLVNLRACAKVGGMCNGFIDNCSELS